MFFLKCLRKTDTQIHLSIVFFLTLYGLICKTFKSDRELFVRFSKYTWTDLNKFELFGLKL